MQCKDPVLGREFLGSSSVMGVNSEALLQLQFRGSSWFVYVKLLNYALGAVV